MTSSGTVNCACPLRRAFTSEVVRPVAFATALTSEGAARIAWRTLKPSAVAAFVGVMIDTIRATTDTMQVRHARAWSCGA